MFKEVIGEWPTCDEFILTSCDEKYLNKFFPRFYKTFTEKWQLPVHVHVIDPTDQTLQRLDRLGISHTYCKTRNEILKWPYAYETYCQAQRFILLGHHVQSNQHVIVADVDAYALRQPSESQHQHLIKELLHLTVEQQWEAKATRVSRWEAHQMLAVNPTQPASTLQMRLTVTKT